MTTITGEDSERGTFLTAVSRRKLVMMYERSLKNISFSGQPDCKHLTQF